MVPGRGPSPGPLALFALLPLGAALRLRRRGQSSRLFAAALLLVIAALLGRLRRQQRRSQEHRHRRRPVGPTGDAGVRDGTLPPPPVSECEMDSDCPDGRVCREVAGENKCIIVDCTDDAAACDVVECANGRAAICTGAGMCECEQPCPEGCPEGQYCCRANYACEPLPETCKDVACEAGFEPMVLSEGMVNEETCQTENVECTCVEKHPLDLGSIGRYSDFVVLGGVGFFSAYAETYGDLVIGKFDQGAQAFTWWWVDGVPAEGMITGGPSGPRGGIADRGPNVGTDTAIALGANGNLHVAYRDVDNQALKYALGVPDGDAFRWTNITLDADGDAGRWASISVDARGVPGIAYRVARRHEGEQWVSQVRYRLAKNDAPAAAADWLPAFVVSDSVLDAPCGGLCARDEVCVASTQTCAAEEASAAPAPRARSAWPAPARRSSTCPRPRAPTPRAPACSPPRSATTPATPSSPGTTAPSVSSGGPSRRTPASAPPSSSPGYGMEGREGDMGSNVDVTIDDRGNAHFCFQDGNTDSLRYLAPELGLDEWVDDGTREDDGRAWAVHVVGEDCNIRLDAGGNPLIVYQDATVQDVVLARRTPEGAWVRTVIRGDEFEYRGAFGFYTRARVEGARLWISNFWWNNQDPAHPEGIEVLFQDL